MSGLDDPYGELEPLERELFLLRDALRDRKAAKEETPLERLRRVHGDLVRDQGSRPKLTLIQGGRE